MDLASLETLAVRTRVRASHVDTAFIFLGAFKTTMAVIALAGSAFLGGNQRFVCSVTGIVVLVALVSAVLQAATRRYSTTGTARAAQRAVHLLAAATRLTTTTTSVDELNGDGCDKGLLRPTRRSQTRLGRISVVQLLLVAMLAATAFGLALDKAITGTLCTNPGDDLCHAIAALNVVSATMSAVAAAVGSAAAVADAAAVALNEDEKKMAMHVVAVIRRSSPQDQVRLQLDYVLG